MAYWLLKTEPETYSIDDLKRDRHTEWTGVRNYQARNFLREMKVGESVLIYHSNAEPPSIVGLAQVKALAGPDLTQFDKRSDVYDPKATVEKPRWFCPTVEFVSKAREPLSLPRIREIEGLLKMVLLQRGSRLSVQPVTKEEFQVITKLLDNRK